MDAHELQGEHPISEIVEHEDQVVVVLERLAFHAGNRLQILRIVLILEELSNLVLHEAGGR